MQRDARRVRRAQQRLTATSACSHHAFPVAGVCPGVFETLPFVGLLVGGFAADLLLTPSGDDSP